MVLSMVIVTAFKEKVRKVSSEITSVPRDQLKQVESEGDVARASLQLFYIPWDTTRTFRDELFMAIVPEVRRLVKEFGRGKIRKPKPKEYELPPIVCMAEATSQQASGWLETFENDIVIIQPLHNPNDNAKLELQSKLTGDGSKRELKHDEVLLIFGNVRFRPEPLGTYFLMSKLSVESEE